MEADGAYERIARHLSSKTSYRPVIAIICGSGLSNLSQSLQNSETFTYASIPEFPQATIDGHKGELVFGTMDTIPCCCFRGRFHFYEGHSMDKVVLPVKIMALMGVKLLIVTNAAGGLNPEFNVGDIMIIQDHFGLVPLSGHNPLRGVNDDATGPRFPSLSDAYDSELQTMVVKAAHTLGLQHKMRSDGTYCFVSGPCYETRAEARLLQTIGGDAVGASTCPECITAKRCGMRVLGLSLITNKVVLTTGKDVQHASHAEVLQAVSESGSDIASILKEIITTDVLGTYVEKIKPLRCSMYTRESKEQQSDIEDMPTTPLGGTMGTEDLSLKSDPQSDLKIDPKSDPKYDAQGRGDGNSSIFSAASQDQRNGEEDNDDLLVYPNEYSDIYCNLLILLGVASVISLCYHLKL